MNGKIILYEINGLDQWLNDWEVPDSGGVDGGSGSSGLTLIHLSIENGQSHSISSRKEASIPASSVHGVTTITPSKFGGQVPRRNQAISKPTTDPGHLDQV